MTLMRKWFLLVLWIGATVPSLAQAPAGPPSASAFDDWRQFRGNPALTGVAAAAPPATLKLLWTFQAGDIIESSVAIAGGVVYAGVGNGDLIAVDLASGQQLWKYSTGNL